MTDGPERRLILVPVLHAQADMGSARESLDSIGRERVGKSEWERHLKAVDDLWESIRDQINGLELDYQNLHLYQDGLPNCGREAEIVADLAEKGSENHRLVLDLMKKGAELVGTESPDLLLEEYELVKEALNSLESGEMDNLREAHRSRRQALLERRDRYIAQRIDETLAPGETGIVFLGLLHSLRGHLPQDIEITELGRSDHRGEA